MCTLYKEEKGAATTEEGRSVEQGNLQKRFKIQQMMEYASC